MALVAGLNLALRFGLEMAMLAALAWWGIESGGNTGLKVLLGIGAPLAAMGVWGMYIAPRASRRLSDPVRVAVEIAMFSLAVAGLVAIDQTVLAVTLAALAALNLTLLFGLRQRQARTANRAA